MTDTSSLLKPPSWDPSSQEELSFRIRELRLRNRNYLNWYHSRSYLYGERFNIGDAIFDFNSSTASTGIVTNIFWWLDLDTRWRRIWHSSPLIGTSFFEWAKKKYPVESQSPASIGVVCVYLHSWLDLDTRWIYKFLIVQKPLSNFIAFIF